MRLDKFFSSQKILSRKECDVYLKKGLISVNGETIRKGDFKIDPEKVLHNIEHYGNMSATSIPCVISEKIKSGEIKTPATVLLSAFGAGMTSAGAIIKIR